MWTALLAACSPKPEGTASETGGSETGGSETGATTGTASAPTTSASATDSSGAPTTGDASGVTGSDSGESGGSETGDEVLCEGAGESTLPGVEIRFAPQKCTFTLAEAMAGVAIAYTVEVADVVEDVSPASGDASACDEPGASGLIVFEELGAGDQHYCVCDVGLCPEPTPTIVSLQAGSYPDTFTWSGTNWSGPSDTANPLGPPFPPGEYVLRVNTQGTWGPGGQSQDFSVTGTFPITLIP